MGMPPEDPGTMTPEEKSALGGRLGLTEGDVAVADVAPVYDVSAGTREVAAAQDRAHAADDGYQAEAKSLATAGQGNTASEGYHFSDMATLIDAMQAPHGDPAPAIQQDRA